MIFKFDDSQALQQFNQYNRKDSGSSEVAAFLNPSGRTSRISSVGSQGSAVSRLSGASAISRSPSPHKMLVETSFCGPKPIEPSSDASSIEQLTADMLENVILARRGDPTKASLAEGVHIRDESAGKSKAKETLPDAPPMTPAEAARAAAKEVRRKEIEALKARLNAINAKQLEKAKAGPTVAATPVVKKVIGVTPEGTEYTRIKLKPDHLYEDKGISPNERIIEDKDFREAKREKTKKVDNSINQISHISPTTHATDNRSPSPASASVSRKSSFCSFFKKDDSSAAKPRSASAASGKGRLNDKSPLPSPSKSCSLSSRIAFTLFKTNRNSPSQLESHEMKPITTQHQSRQPLNLKDKPKLKYYDTPSVIHIPLHTPPEEKEFSALKKTKDDDEKIEAAPAVAPVRHEKPISVKPKIAPTAKIESVQSTDEVELHELPIRKASAVDDREGGGSSLWSVEVQRHSSQESQETVISSQLKNDTGSKNGSTDKPAIPAYIDTINENPPNNQQPMSAAGRHKKHILFCTKIGSGSEEQIFTTQLSLSKTESQSSQLSEQASVFESPKNEENGTKVPEIVTRNSLKHQSSSEVEKVTATSARSRRSDQSDSADSRPQSVTRKQQHQRDSGEFSKKRESSDDSLRKKRGDSSDDALRRKQEKLQSHSSHSIHTPSQHSQHSSQHSQTSLKSTEKPQSLLQHQSSGSKMEISSESDHESDLDACGVHKRVSRIMEDHESAGLVLQESFDDELPYVPTSLPEERSSGLRIVPTKDRTQNELITIPVDRPRSTTPINPASLDNYCERKQSDASESSSLVRGEKLRISLPKQKAEQTKEKVQQKVITRRISNLSNKSWTEFAEQQQTPAAPPVKKAERSRKQSSSSQDDDPPPPPPPSKSHSKKSLTSKWIDFENIPEKRQPPKKITTLPSSKEPASEKGHKHGHHHRHYVSPEECQCECHESVTKKDPDSNKPSPAESGKTTTSEDSQPLLDDHAERNSLMRLERVCSQLICSHVKILFIFQHRLVNGMQLGKRRSKLFDSQSNSSTLWPKQGS